MASINGLVFLIYLNMLACWYNNSIKQKQLAHEGF